MDSHQSIPRRRVLQAIGAAFAAAPLHALAQGRCMLTLGSPACNTSDIPQVFAPTGWKTVSLEHLTFDVADYRKEAAFYTALMGWTLRSDDGRQAVMDIGDWGSVIFKQVPEDAFPSRGQSNADETAGAGGRGGGRGRGGQNPPLRAIVQSFCFGIDPWNAKTVESELKKRGLAPVAENGPNGFESFRVKDPDGFGLQISNGAFAKTRKKSPAAAKLSEPAPFESTGWKTVWLDHFSFGASDYKKSVSFYTNLL